MIPTLQYEDAFILGMMLSKYIIKRNIAGFNYVGQSWNDYRPKFGDSSTGNGTGCGGDLSGAGDKGKPGAGDEHFPPSTPSLCGAGGTLAGPGTGYLNGTLGRGANGSQTMNSYVSSAGGGGGLFGGGSSMLSGGGGGGSSFVLSGFGLYAIPTYLLNTILSDNRHNSFIGQWVGIEGDTSIIQYDEDEGIYGCPWLYDLNTTSNAFYLSKWETVMGTVGYNFLKSFRQNINNDGAVYISNVNELIEIKKTQYGDIENNIPEEWSLEGVGEEFLYTGECVKYTIPETGNYHIICYGACGGDYAHGVYQFMGGFGGFASGIFYFEAGTDIFVYVGQQGNIGTYPGAWNGGGFGAGGQTSGGGASDVRWDGEDESTDWQSTLNTRFIVAGGGGGCNGMVSGQLPSGVIVEGDNTSFDNDVDDNRDIKHKKEIKIKNLKYLVNDRSIVYVKINYYTQVELREDAKIVCILYVNGGKDGVLQAEMVPTPERGVYEFIYHLSDIYPQGTKTKNVTIDVTIKGNVGFLIPEGGVNIRVETSVAPGEGHEYGEGPSLLKIIDTVGFKELIHLAITNAPVETIPKSIIEKIKLSDIGKIDITFLDKTEADSEDTVGASEKIKLNIKHLSLLDKVQMIETIEIGERIKIIIHKGE